MSFAKDLMRIVRRPSLALCVLKGLRDRRFVEQSEWFDSDWYRKESIDGNFSGLPLALHYSITGFHPDVLPCPDFVPAEYFSLHPDARGTNPLVHYERKGKRKGYAISYLQAQTGSPPHHVSLMEHQTALAETARRVGAKMKRGEPLRVLFLVYSTSMFPARPLFDQMRKDPAFDPKIAIVPDLRWETEMIYKKIELTRTELDQSYPNEVFLDMMCDERGEWPDILSDSDIAVWNTPYSLSNFRFNPHWAVGRSFLPIHVSYGYWMSPFGDWIMQRHNLGYFWKALFECQHNIDQYRAKSRIGGTNGVLTGYVKMDALNTFESQHVNLRKRILLCPHHSIEAHRFGGFTSSTFLRFANYFLELPKKHPEFDYVFRPHPHLFPRLESKSVWGKRRTNAWRERFLAHPNVIWNEGGDYLREFSRADAIIQDCGSFLPEWLYTGKPGCFMLRPNEPLEKEFSPFGIDCLKRYYVARQEDEIERFLSTVILEGNDPLRQSRRDFFKTVAINYPHAAEAAIDEIKRSLILSFSSEHA